MNEVNEVEVKEKGKKPEKKPRGLKKSLMPKSGFRASLTALICASLPLAAVLTAAMMTVFEADVQYFKANAAMPAAFRAAEIILCAAAFLIPFAMTNDDLPQRAGSPDPVTVFAALAAAIFLAALAVTDVRAVIERRSDITQSLLSADATGFAHRLNIVTVPCVAAAAVSCVYFVVTAIRPSARKLRGWLGIGVPAFFIFRLLMLYYDTSAPINSPVKILDQLAGAAALLFSVGNLRAVVSASRPRFFYRWGAITVLLMLPSAVSQIVYMAADGTAKSVSGFYPFVQLAFALYAAARVISSLFAREPLIPDPVDVQSVPTVDGAATDTPDTPDVPEEESAQ